MINMNQNINFWMFNENIHLKTNINENIQKIANIGDHLFVLTQNLNLYQGIIERSEDGLKFVELTQIANFKLLDIDSCKENLFIVTTEGNVFVCDEQLTILSEISLIETFKCPQGHSELNHKIKVKKLTVSEYGRLYISENNQLWGSGHMPQVELNSDTPKKINFFSDRRIYNISIGSDFAVIVVSKNLKSDEIEAVEKDPFMPNCLNCLSLSQRPSPESQIPTNDICPLGIKINSSFNLKDIQSNGENDYVSLECLDENQHKINVEKNIIFRNTEAAKEFLTRQISRMSSVGEEYLIECTEKPTRIIKENMSNMATFVYEGVKIVGDKVATLSRHVSASSDCNSISENNNGQIVYGKNSKEDILLSGSQSTSEKDLSEVEIQEIVDGILIKGLDLLNREVWTWGNIFHGLSGVGEIKKELPVIISILSNTGVCKISLQKHHACALTLDGRAFIWGQNNFHQVTLENNFDQMSPKLFVCNMKERVRDAICGTHFTVILTNKSNVTYFGKGSESYQTIFNKFMSENKEDESLPVNLFDNLLSTKQFSLLSLGPKSDEGFSNFLFNEQIMLEEMLCVHQCVIKPFVKKTNNIDNALLYDSLCKSYADMLYFLCASVKSLLEHRNGLISLDDISILKYFKEYILVYKGYVNVVQNVASINGFEYISKLVNISSSLYRLKPGTLKEKDSSDKDISLILLSPVKRINNYTDFFRKYVGSDIQLKWKEFADYSETKAKEAEKTHSFWLTSGKNIGYLTEPERRLICDSQTDPINLQNSSRFSSHRFVLFTDIFAHINGSSSHLHNLTMVWLELPHHDTFHLLCLKMPEETLTLVAPDGVVKNKWYHALQHAIKIALNKTDLLQPPLARSGTYTFSKSRFFKDATYTGRWLNAKMHGTGKVKWPDGRIYVGQFSNNVLSGYGTIEIPNVGSYEGQWKDNKQNGYGTFTYYNKDIYRGYFKDDAPHGHGLLRKGNFMANSASLYIGEWISGHKSGYGIMDDIATGEKYIGSWEESKKEGNGLIVTSDGIYYEGNFHNDVLSGHGIMVLEDRTHYEGEFKGTGIVGGKGTLTLSSGHVIEGNLVGSVEEGIKINAGMFHIGVQTPLPKSFGKLCTPPSQKWNALFRHCYHILGLSENNIIDGSANSSETPKIWQNVAVHLANASTLKRNKGDDNVFQNSLNNLDVIPPFGRDRMTMESYLEIKTYLNRAFESSLHPVGSLLNHLSEAYIASYTGKIHPILVTHAILEIIDLTQRIYEIIRYLFPALPACDTDCIISNNEKDEIISYQSLLYPIILPKIYNCLSTLMTLKNENLERQYKRALMEWNKLSDRRLMSILSVDKKFFNLDQSINLSEKSCVFVEAIETLQQIKSMFLPIEKLMIIRNTVEKMTPIAQNLLGDRYVWNMDDLFPLFLYVVVRARIPDLGAELEFMENFMDPSLENGELGIMFTTLKACYQQILQDKSFY